MYPVQWFKDLHGDDQVAALGLLGAVIAFFIGLWQYNRSQRWKRKEWVAEETRRFLTDPSVRQALLMIDWWERRVVLFPNHADPAMRVARVDDDTVARALLHHKLGQPFNPLEAAVRDVFDEFLDGLARMQQFVTAKLIRQEDLTPYLEYWIERVGRLDGGGKPNARLRQLHQYIQDYKFKDVVTLLNAYGHVLRTQPSSEIERLAHLDRSDWLMRFEDQITGQRPRAASPSASSDGLPR